MTGATNKANPLAIEFWESGNVGLAFSAMLGGSACFLGTIVGFVSAGVGVALAVPAALVAACVGYVATPLLISSAAKGIATAAAAFKNHRFQKKHAIVDQRFKAATRPIVKPNIGTPPCIGAKMPDGSIYAGMSPDTGKAMYATPADAPLTYTFNEAKEYVAKLDAHGHQDWRVPTKAELNVLFNNRAAVGGFNVGGSLPAGWYWSASQDGRLSAWCQRFSDGVQHSGIKDNHLPVRCVR